MDSGRKTNVRKDHPVDVILASGNPNKFSEFLRLFSGSVVRMQLPADAGSWVEAEECGDSFLENARIKAVAYARAFCSWSLADDSGLEVDVLGGKPGVQSARFAGARASDEDRNAKLLRLLEGVPQAQRSARFQCALAIAAPDASVVFTVLRECVGQIGTGVHGCGGFGYDPLFIVGTGRLTMAEMSSDEKDRVGHRGQAARVAREFLEQRLG